MVQAALVHAQFETIHPFTDGNGRVGRALIHTVFARRGLTPVALLPISMVLATFDREYITGLTSYRHAAVVDEVGVDGVDSASASTWIEAFAMGALTACDQAELIASELTGLREEWLSKVKESRKAAGAQRELRADSATLASPPRLRGVPGRPPERG